MRISVRVTNAGAAADQIDAVIPAMGELTGSGRVLSTNQLDFDLIVKVASAKDIGKIGVSLLTKSNNSGGTDNDRGVPLHVAGSPEDPYITADISGIIHKKIKSIGSIFNKKK